MLRVLDLFSGIGGFSLGLERAGMRTVAFCEIEPFCRAVLRKHWPEVPCFEDVRLLHASDVGPVDVICGGFPCQDISFAGKRAGIEGKESGLWGEYSRLICELRPRYVIVENVAVLRSRGLGRVLGDLASLGYDAEWHCIPAYYVGSPQSRDRIWIVAYPMQQGETWRRAGGLGGRRDGEGKTGPHGWAGNAFEDVQLWPEPSVARVADGVPSAVDRINALGNAVVPQIPEIIGRTILAAEGEKA